MTAENEAKKDYLNQYRKSRHLEKQYREELARLYVDYSIPSTKEMDDMPHGSGNNADLSSGYIAVEGVTDGCMG